MQKYIRRALAKIVGTAPATIDTIEPGSIVVAPRKPIDLTDESAITEVLDLASKVGAVLLDSGTGAIDTRRQIEFVAGVYGLEHVEADVTYNTIIVTARRGATLPPVTAMRSVHYRSLDFTRLAQVDRLVRRIRVLALTPGTAHRIVDGIISAAHPYPYWASTLSWGLMAMGVSMLLGAPVPIALAASVTTWVIVTINRWLNSRGVLPFFQQIIGGFIAVIPAMQLYALRDQLGLNFVPSQIIAAGIIVLLSGLSLVGSVQDVITGAPITGTARFAEVIVMTGGILAGVGLGLRLMQAVGLSMPAFSSAVPVFAPVDLPAQIAGGAIAAFGFAAASYAERRALPAAFLSGAVAAGVAAGLNLTSAGPLIAASAAAVIVGLVGGLAARRALTPPLVVAVAGITPLLPGLAIYRGLYAIMDGESAAGFGAMVNALTVGGALAAGVTLGEFVARTLRRPTVPKVVPPWRRRPL